MSFYHPAHLRLWLQIAFQPIMIARLSRLVVAPDDGRDRALILKDLNDIADGLEWDIVDDQLVCELSSTFGVDIACEGLALINAPSINVPVLACTCPLAGASVASDWKLWTVAREPSTPRMGKEARYWRNAVRPYISARKRDGWISCCGFAAAATVDKEVFGWPDAVIRAQIFLFSGKCRFHSVGALSQAVEKDAGIAPML
jgi:hypothetical protein